VELLDRATRLGLDSKMFDPQALLLLAFARLDNNDQRGLQRTVEQLTRLRDRSHDPSRPHRLLKMAESLQALQQQQTARAQDDVRRLAGEVLNPEFDFESACNLLALMNRLMARSLPLHGAAHHTGGHETEPQRRSANPTVEQLLDAGDRTGNAKLIESSHQVFPALLERAEALRQRFHTDARMARLGEKTAGASEPGAVSLPAGYKTVQREGVLDASQPA
jgi:hypothetical protein